MYSENKLINRYLTRLKKIRKLSDNTIVSYRTDIIGFEKFIKEKGLELTDVKEKHLEDYQMLMNGKGWADATINRKMIALKEFYKYLYTKEGLERDPARGIELYKLKKRLPKYLTEKQAQKLINAVGTERRDFYRTRDKLMLLMFITTGLRLSGLSNIKMKDITGNTLTIIEKGDSQREVGLDSIVLEALKEYKKHRDSDSEYLFISNRKQKISNRQIQSIVEKYLKIAKLDKKGFTVHTLRHTAATLMSEKGEGIEVIQRVLGHASITTTQIYVHVNNNRIKQASSKVAEIFK